jgi:outer membrane lipoprotein SlyB
MMKRINHTAVLAGLVTLLLGACSSTSSDMASRADSAPVSSEAARDVAQDASRAPATQGSSMTGQSESMQAGRSTASMPPDQAQPAPSNATIANSVVTLIETVPRQNAVVGTGAMAGAAVGGSMPGSDRVYRVTLHMDDGSTRVVTQETTPSYRAGDRVRLDSGIITTQ